MSKNVKIIVSWAAVLLWMLFIFKMSSQVAIESNDLSLGITGLLYKLMDGFIRFNQAAVNHIVRKGAHFTAYLLLGILTLNALSSIGITKYRKVIIAFSICVLYAISDEIHQLFVPGRSGQPGDVLIDSLGAGVGIAIHLLIELFFKSKKIKKART